MPSWIPGVPPGATDIDDVLGLRPNLLEGYRDFAARLWSPGVMDADILELCRLAVAAELGCGAELAVRTSTALEAGLDEGRVRALGRWRTDPAFDERTRRCLSFAEQFVLDPGGIAADERTALRRDLGMARLVGLANGLAVFDGFDRLRLVLGIGHAPDAAGAGAVTVRPPGPADPRFDTVGPAVTDPDDPALGFANAQPGLFASFQRFYAELWSAGVVDHPSKEVARLRNARLTGCRFCRNVRFDQARRDGLSEDQVDLIGEGYEQSALPPGHKAVLRLADCFLTAPRAGVPEALQAELLERFGAAGVVELAVGLALFVGFSKIAVSLGAFPDDFATTVIETPVPADRPGGPSR